MADTPDELNRSAQHLTPAKPGVSGFMRNVSALLEQQRAAEAITYYDTYRLCLGESPVLREFDTLFSSVRGKLASGSGSASPATRSPLDMEREFWNVPSLGEAMFSRVFTDSTINALPPEKQIEAWHRSAQNSVRLVLSGIPHAPGWRVLEIGCGVGRVIKPMRGMFARVDGVDIAEKMIEYARQYLADAGGEGRLEVNNGADLRAFGDAEYDLVFSMIVFQHIRSASVVRGYFREILRVLKPGGYFRLQVHDTSNPNLGRFDEEAAAGVQYRLNGNGYTPEQVRGLLVEQGYEVVAVESMKPWIWATAVKPGSKDGRN